MASEYQQPITIQRALKGIEQHDLVLPAIQREFVWKTDQTCRLLDSLMRGYPVGNFLFWRISQEHVGDYQLYDFVCDYHQKNSPHCPELSPMGDRDVTAVLDGQQRLTALNIALRGSHAEKKPYGRWSNPDAFPRKRLYLNLAGDAPENDDGLLHDFRFLTEAEAEKLDAEGGAWFRVPNILKFEDLIDAQSWLADRELGNDKAAFKRLGRLHQLVHSDKVIHSHLEEEQDPDRVLDIFIRVNSGGTRLSHSDLLLSMATAHWQDLSARSAVHDLVDELNATGAGFGLSKDLVLKAGLMLADIGSVGFQVRNFNADNMKVLEQKWDSIARALRVAVQLFADFGFSQANLRTDSVLLPVAYYAHLRQLGDGYRMGETQVGDRTAMRCWVLKTLVKAGVWGSGLDTLLTALRDALREHGQHGFPVDALEATLRRRGRALRFEDDEIEDLLDTSYSDWRSFALLSLLYPQVNLTQQVHVDHVFPQSRFSVGRLRRAGVPRDDRTRYRELMNQLPNLQLLIGPVNESKRARMPAEWLAQAFPTEEQRQHYLDLNDLGVLPDSLDGFPEFHAARRERMAVRLRNALGLTETATA